MLNALLFIWVESCYLQTDLQNKGDIYYIMIYFHSRQPDTVQNTCDLSSTAESCKADQTSYSISSTGNTASLVPALII